MICKLSKKFKRGDFDEDELYGDNLYMKEIQSWKGEDAWLGDVVLNKEREQVRAYSMFQIFYWSSMKYDNTVANRGIAYVSMETQKNNNSP